MNKFRSLIAISSVAVMGLSITGCVMECEHCDKKEDSHHHTASHVISDSSITTAIKAKYFADPNISGMNIHVVTINGKVILTGNVPSQKMKNLAVAIAEETEGVKKVNFSKLRVVESSTND